MPRVGNRYLQNEYYAILSTAANLNKMKCKSYARGNIITRESQKPDPGASNCYYRPRLSV